MNEHGSADIYATAAEAALANAQRAGLVWRLIPATVLTTGIAGVRIVMDGDDDPITAQSLIGRVSAGYRVMVMDVPPQGKYIIGWYGAPLVPVMYGYSDSVAVSFAAASVQTANVVFPEAFPATPDVVCQVVSPSGSAVKSTVLVTAVSTTGFSIRVDLIGAATLTINVAWHAVVSAT